jgi:hypothetical protein
MFPIASVGFGFSFLPFMEIRGVARRQTQSLDDMIFCLVGATYQRYEQSPTGMSIGQIGFSTNACPHSAIPWTRRLILPNY